VLNVDQQIVTYSPRVKTGALLPEFPAVTDIILTNDVTEDKVVCNAAKLFMLS